MPLDVSQIDRSLLAHSPLTSVICQVRFNPTPAAGDARKVQELRKKLGGEAAFPGLEPITEASINISIAPNAPPVSQQQNSTGWRMSSQDGKRVVVLLPSAVALEVFSYPGWDAYGQELETLLSAVAESVEPVFEQRLGLRYINQLTTPDVRAPEGWREFIDPAFLGFGTHEEIASMVTFSRQQVVLQLDEDARCTIHQGYAPDEERDNALTYILDFDIAREGTRPFDSSGIREAADRFNAYALRLFQLSTTSELRSHLTS